MSHNTVYDHSIAFKNLSRNNLGTIDKFALAAVVAQTELLFEREKYRHMCEDERHDKIINSIRASPHFNLLMKDMPSDPSVSESSLVEMSDLSALHSDSVPVGSECNLNDCENCNDFSKYSECDEYDNYEDDDNGDMDPIYTQHRKAFIAQNTANIGYNV